MIIKIYLSPLSEYQYFFYSIYIQIIIYNITIFYNYCQLFIVKYNLNISQHIIPYSKWIQIFYLNFSKRDLSIYFFIAFTIPWYLITFLHTFKYYVNILTGLCRWIYLFLDPFIHITPICLKCVFIIIIICFMIYCYYYCRKNWTVYLQNCPAL